MIKWCVGFPQLSRLVHLVFQPIPPLSCHLLLVFLCFGSNHPYSQCGISTSDVALGSSLVLVATPRKSLAPVDPPQLWPTLPSLFHTHHVCSPSHDCFALSCLVYNSCFFMRLSCHLSPCSLFSPHLKHNVCGKVIWTYSRKIGQYPQLSQSLSEESKGQGQHICICSLCKLSQGAALFWASCFLPLPWEAGPDD